MWAGTGFALGAGLVHQSALKGFREFCPLVRQPKVERQKFRWRSCRQRQCIRCMLSTLPDPLVDFVGHAVPLGPERTVTDKPKVRSPYQSPTVTVVRRGFSNPVERRQDSGSRTLSQRFAALFFERVLLSELER